MGIKNKSLNLDKDILYDLYVNKQLSTVKLEKIFNCSSPTIRKYLKQYNIPIRTFSEATTIQAKSRTPEQLRDRAKKCRETWYSKSEDERLKINKTRATKPETVAEQVRKIKETKSLHKSGKQSKAEDRFYELLQITFDTADIVRQYYCNEYPFNCDFYIKSRQLFIEFQGHPTHGPHPYKDDEEDKQLLEQLSKHLDMTTWTKRDVNKLNVAKQNNIKLVLVYPDKIFILENSQIRTSQLNELWKM